MIFGQSRSYSAWERVERIRKYLGLSIVYGLKTLRFDRNKVGDLA